MIMMILAVITIFFALVGLADIFVGAGRWVRRTGRLDSAVLAVEITPEEKAAEATLLQAMDAVAEEPALRGVHLVVICPGEGENQKICRSFCEDRSIPMVSQWSEIHGMSLDNSLSKIE
ncbi:MAG: hypothetical protein RR461_05400 [Angelakisella sp.]